MQHINFLIMKRNKIIKNRGLILIDIGRYWDIGCRKSRTININQYQSVSTSIYSLFLLFLFLSNPNIVYAIPDGRGNEIFLSGNLGIGTTAPSQALHVVGNARITGLNCSSNSSGGAITADVNGNLSCSDDNDGGGLWTDGGATTYVTSQTDDLAVGASSLVAPFSVDESANTVRIGEGSNSDGILAMYASNGVTGTITYLTVFDSWYFSGGNIGIGTTAPEVKLDVTNAGVAGDVGVEIDAFSPGDPFLRFEISHNPIWTIGVDDSNSDKFTIGTTALDTSIRLTIDSNSNVGIGTTAPSTKLTVTQGNSTGILALSGNGAFVTDIAIGRTAIEGKLGIAAIAGSYATGAQSGDLILRNESSSQKLFLSAGTTETMTITNTNVGIGVSAPAAALDVMTSDTASSYLGALWLQRIDSDSAAADDLGESIEFFLEMATSASYEAGSIDVVWEDSGDTSEDSSIRFNTTQSAGVAEAMRIDNLGNVGIGHSDPDASFEIVDNGGDIFMISSDATTNGDFFIVKTSGNVGIGDSTPDAMLEIATTGGVTPLMVSNGTAGDGDFFVVRSDGNVGVGDSTPEATLEVVDAGADILNISDGASGNGDFLIMNTSGCLGIGVTAPRTQVHMALVTGGTMMLSREDTTTTADELLGEILFDSTDDDESSVDASVAIRAYASQAHSATEKGGYLQFWTKATDTDENAAAAVRMHITDAAGVTSVGIGTSAPTGALQVTGGFVFIGDGSTGAVTTAAADGDLYVEDALEVDGSCTGAGSCDADVAEEFDAIDGVKAGDIVVLNNKNYKTVQYSSKPYDQEMIGVVSTKPTIIMGSGNFRKNPIPLALSGVAPVKVCLENGPIKIGDYITSSSTPGVGMKATKAGKVIGVALEDYGTNLSSPNVLIGDLSSAKIPASAGMTDKIVHFIDVHWWGGQEEELLESLAKLIKQQEKNFEREKIINRKQEEEIKGLYRDLEKLEKNKS